MKKRLRKKLSKRKCLSCGTEGGVLSHHKLKTGRWVSGKLTCFYCDKGIQRYIVV